MNHKFRLLLYGLAICSGCLALFFALLPCLTLAITFGTTFYHFAVRLLVGWLGRLLFPSQGEHAAWFREQPWEAGLYRRFKVRRWKNKMPTYRPGDFDLKVHTPGQIIRATCISEITHEIITVLSFLPVLAIPKYGAPAAFWITSILASLFDGCFAVMQRYNRPRLLKLQQREARRL